MALKINRFQLENFKVFENFVFDFRDMDFLMFDGPNGFGKTSFYDAVELLFTGKIRRYNDLAKLIVDGRETFSENPYLNANFPDADILIKAELIANGELLIISRCCANADLGNSASFEKFRLYHHNNFLDTQGTLINDEQTFLTPFLGKNYSLNFQFLNYVEQEDSAYLLRNKEAAKKKAIDHLFNVEELQSKLNKINEVRSSISELCKPQKKTELKAEIEALKALKNEMTGTHSEVPYVKLFPHFQLQWDLEHIPFGEGVYESFFEATGPLPVLKKLANKKELILAQLQNDRLERLMQNKGWENFLKYQYFTHVREELVEAGELASAINAFKLQISEITLEMIDQGELNFSEEIAAILTSEFVEKYQNALEDLEFKLEQSNQLQKILAALEASRTSLLKNFENYRTISNPEDVKDCPLCGQEYDLVAEDSPASLMASINAQTISLEAVLDASKNDLSKSLQSFRNNEVAELSSELDKFRKNNPIDIAFARELGKQNVNDFDLLSKALEEYDIDPTPFLNYLAETETEMDLEGFELLFSAKLTTIQPGEIDPDMIELYLELFDDPRSSFETLTPEDVEVKTTYIKWQHSIYKSVVIKDRELKIKEHQLQIDRASTYSGELKKLEKAYSDALAGYQKSLIRDIEILFHIYSGRIIQDFQGGLGLFIKEGRGIKFVTDPAKTFDAVFTMSSGQIAALVISFTLSLNKKYSQNKVLFIDDPVQTMDELNIAGLVELLRNDFSDRQIFISTHEDKMSTYMRYKFEKFGLRSKRLSLKVAQLN